MSEEKFGVFGDYILRTIFIDAGDRFTVDLIEIQCGADRIPRKPPPGFSETYFSVRTTNHHDIYYNSQYMNISKISKKCPTCGKKLKEVCCNENKPHLIFHTGHRSESNYPTYEQALKAYEHDVKLFNKR